jgi:2-polyprenyl-3-methyl-5-hydroxy-6-metoxy-1,4-benzoquinol methylase
MFDARVASRELRRYRRKGPRRATRDLCKAIRLHSPGASTVLDIGPGIGALTFELLEAGIQHAIAVDASSAFLDAAREEAARRGVAHRIEWRHADFVAVAASLPAADIVTLDRVVCCYPAIEELLAESASHARRCLAISYPLEHSSIRAVIGIQNFARRLTGNEFELFVHPVGRMEEIVRRAGFALARRHGTWVWGADIYIRDRIGPKS